MSDPEDRILDFALRRLLGAQEEVDQAADIARAWERGDHGSVKLKADPARDARGGGPRAVRHNGHAAPPDAARPATTPGARPRPAAVARYRAALAAAAAVLVLGGTAWLLAGRLANEAPPALASGRFALLVNDRFEPPFEAGVDRELESGATLWVPPGSPANLRLASGARLEVAGDSLARIVSFEPAGASPAAPGLRLEYGSLRATTPAQRGLDLDVAGVAVALAPGSELEVLALFDATRPAPTAADSYAALAARFEAPSLGWVSVRVPRGAARIRSAGEERDLRAGGEAFVALGTAPAFVPAQELADLRGSITELRQARPYPQQGLAKCRAALAARPALLVALAETLAQGLRSEDSSWGARRDLLELLVDDPTRTALRLVRAIWLERPEEFSDDQKIALAERGVPEFEREAIATLTWYDADDEDTDPVPAALYLALRGEDLAVRYLQDALQIFDVDPFKAWDDVPRALAAASVLRRLGMDEPWERALAWTGRTLDDSLGQGMFQASASLVISLEFMDALGRDTPGELPQVGRLLRRLEERIDERLPDFETEQDVRDLLAHVSGR